MHAEGTMDLKLGRGNQSYQFALLPQRYCLLEVDFTTDSFKNGVNKAIWG